MHRTPLAVPYLFSIRTREEDVLAALRAGAVAIALKRGSHVALVLAALSLPGIDGWSLRAGWPRKCQP